MNETKQTPSAFLSLLPLVVLVLMLVATIRAYGSDSLAGASQVTLLVVSAFCVLLGTQFLKVPWAEFEQAITRNVSSVTSVRKLRKQITNMAIWCIVKQDEHSRLLHWRAK